MEIVEFWTYCSANGIVLDAEQREQIKRYESEMKYWNKQVNLISRKDEDNFLEKHVFHSLSIMKYIEIPAKSVCLDIGTGGGLPGIPLAIANPSIKMLLMDSIAKKLKITRLFAQHTGIKGLTAETGRIEDLAKSKEHLEKYDFIFARAVTGLVHLCDWSLPLLKKTGKMVFLKGGTLMNEKNNAWEKYPNLEIEEHLIKFKGYDSFEKEEKKVLICRFK